VVFDLLAEPVAEGNSSGFGGGGAGEDQLLAGGRVDAAEDPYLEPRAALTDARQVSRLRFRVVMARTLDTRIGTVHGTTNG
jgi:hypothetical protein